MTAPFNIALMLVLVLLIAAGYYRIKCEITGIKSECPYIEAWR